MAEVRTAAEFIDAARIGEEIFLAADIDFSNSGWSPSGIYENLFDGGFFTISGLGAQGRLFDDFRGIARKFRFSEGRFCNRNERAIIEDGFFNGAHYTHPVFGETGGGCVFNRLAFGELFRKGSIYSLPAAPAAPPQTANQWHYVLFFGAHESSVVSFYIPDRDNSVPSSYYSHLLLPGVFDEAAFLAGNPSPLIVEQMTDHRLRRVIPWISEDTAPPGADFGVRLYRNLNGGGWQRFKTLMTLNSNLMQYEFTDEDIEDTSEEVLGGDVDVVRGRTLPAPVGARNLTPHANGFFVCSAGARFYASLPGNPTAWPAIYTLDFPEEIKQIVEFSDRFLVLCETKVYEVNGGSPVNLFTRDLELVFEPRGAAARVGSSVHYLSGDGVAVYSGELPDLATATMMTRRDFAAYSDESFAASVDGRYFLFSGHRDALCYSPRDGGAICDLRFFAAPPSPDNFERAPSAAVIAAVADKEQLILSVLDDDGIARIWEWTPLPPHYAPRQTARWRSRVFRFPRPVSFRAAKVRADDFFGQMRAVEDVPVSVGADDFRYGVGNSPVGGGRFDMEPAGGLFYAMSVGGMGNAPQQGVVQGETILDVWADGRIVYREPHAHLFQSEAFDMPGGFRATEWQVQVTTTEVLTGIALARSKSAMARSGI